MDFDLIHEIENRIADIKSQLIFFKNLTEYEADILEGELESLQNDLDNAMS